MSDPCTRTFGDELLTGYVDQSLTQSDEQRVRIHLEDCETCRRAVAELLALRELTMTSTFRVPDDVQWDETPKNRASWAALSLGWILIIAVVTVWAVVADANRYFAGEAPWALAKTDPARQGTVLYVTTEVLRQVAILAQPFIPASAGKLLDILGIPANERSFDRLRGDATRIAPGTALPPPAPVFPRYVEPEAAKA